jgi:hypothetical protein
MLAVREQVRHRALRGELVLEGEREWTLLR